MNPSEKKQSRAAAAVVLLTALSMRASMSTVGPLIGAIRSDLHLNSTVAGFLTTIPLVIFAAASPAAGRIAAAVDSRRLLCACSALGIVGLALRSCGGPACLFLGTALLGLSIAVQNVLLPAFIRFRFPSSVGPMMGLYSTSMIVSSAAAAGSCQTLAGIWGGWRLSLFAPVVFSLAALLACVWAGGAVSGRLPAGDGGGGRPLGRKIAAIAIFMGPQSFLFFSLITWYPSIVKSSCPAVKNSGLLVLLMQAASLLPSLGFPVLIQRLRRRGLAAALSALLFTAGFALLLPAPGNLPLVLTGTVIIGFACGATISLALTLIAMQGAAAGETARVSASVQCVSYLIAAFGPTSLGFLFDRFSSWTPVLWILLGFSLAMACAGLCAGGERRGEIRA